MVKRATNSPYNGPGPKKSTTSVKNKDGSYSGRPTTKKDLKKVARAQKKRAVKKTAAYKATKGTSSKKAVRRTAKKVAKRSGTTTGAKAQARYMVRSRKMKANAKKK